MVEMTWFDKVLESFGRNFEFETLFINEISGRRLTDIMRKCAINIGFNKLNRGVSLFSSFCLFMFFLMKTDLWKNYFNNFQCKFRKRYQTAIFRLFGEVISLPYFPFKHIQRAFPVQSEISLWKISFLCIDYPFNTSSLKTR